MSKPETHMAVWVGSLPLTNEEKVATYLLHTATKCRGESDVWETSQQPAPLAKKLDIESWKEVISIYSKFNLIPSIVKVGGHNREGYRFSPSAIMQVCREARRAGKQENREAGEQDSADITPDTRAAISAATSPDLGLVSARSRVQSFKPPEKSASEMVEEARKLARGATLPPGE